MRFFRRRRLFMDLDGRGGGGGTPSGQDPTPTGSEDKAPAYFSQFKKENQERFKPLSKYKSLDDLADAAIKGEELAGDKNYIKKPTEDSTPEEIKAFLSALGVPESKDAYELPKKDGESPFLAGARETLSEQAFRAGLTKSQATSMWGVVMAINDSAENASKKALEERVSGFDSRLDKLLEKSYPDKAKRDGAIKETIGHLSTFLSETGLGKALEDSGLLYDENVVKALADYQKSKVGTYRSGGSGGGKEKDNGYCKEFNERYGRRN